MGLFSMMPIMALALFALSGGALGPADAPSPAVDVGTVISAQSIVMAVAMILGLRLIRRRRRPR